MGGGGKGGGTSTTASSEIDVDSESTSSVEIMGLDEINAELTLRVPDTIKTEASNAIETSSTIDVKPLEADIDNTTKLSVDPLNSDSSITVDLKPAVVDLCLTMNMGKLPNVCVRQPYHHHVGITLFGAELWGITVSGEQQTVMEELDRSPKVAWGGTTTAWPPDKAEGSRPAQPATRQAGGLRIQLGS
jgi:hypothetical protein